MAEVCSWAAAKAPQLDATVLQSFYIDGRMLMVLDYAMLGEGELGVATRLAQTNVLLEIRKLKRTSPVPTTKVVVSIASNERLSECAPPATARTAGAGTGALAPALAEIRALCAE